MPLFDDVLRINPEAPQVEVGVSLSTSEETEANR